MINKDFRQNNGIPMGIDNNNNRIGKSYHNHTYETIHYDFLLDNSLGIWNYYPGKGSLPYMDLDKLLYYSLCCMAEMGEFMCGDNKFMNSIIFKDYESQDQKLKVKILDEILSGRSCILTFTLDIYEL
jgi:hypothetical protein